MAALVSGGESGTTRDLDDEDFEIVEHEHAHAVALCAGGDSSFMNEKYEECRMSPGTAEFSNLEPFLDQFSGMINHGNLKAILKDQERMLGTLEISNEKLASLNNISEKNYSTCANEFKVQTQALLGMKKQLDSCFRRIRHLKSKLAAQYPEAYQAALQEQQQTASCDDNSEDR